MSKKGNGGEYLMYSMTGYGKGEYKENGIELTVEIKTVNNRFLDVSLKRSRPQNRDLFASKIAVTKKIKLGKTKCTRSY